MDFAAATKERNKMTIIKFEISYEVADTRKAIKRAISDIEEDLRIGDYNTDEQIIIDTHHGGNNEDKNPMLFEDDVTAKEYLKRKERLCQI